MKELRELRDLLLHLTDTVSRQRVDMRKARALMGEARNLVVLLTQMQQSMQCADSTSEEICVSLSDEHRNARCSWDQAPLDPTGMANCFFIT